MNVQRPIKVGTASKVTQIENPSRPRRPRGCQTRRLEMMHLDVILHPKGVYRYGPVTKSNPFLDVFLQNTRRGHHSSRHCSGRITGQPLGQRKPAPKWRRARLFEAGEVARARGQRGRHVELDSGRHVHLQGGPPRRRGMLEDDCRRRTQRRLHAPLDIMLCLRNEMPHQAAFRLRELRCNVCALKERVRDARRWGAQELPTPSTSEFPRACLRSLLDCWLRRHAPHEWRIPLCAVVMKQRRIVQRVDSTSIKLLIITDLRPHDRLGLFAKQPYAWRAHTCCHRTLLVPGF